LAKDVGIALFRILQESLQNVTRHARASQVTITVSMEQSRKALRLIVADDGVGLSADRLRTLGSHGLGIMRHRMRAIGGQFRVQSVMGQGTQIAVVVPVLEQVEAV
jgi:signal transduction histidine kinase